MDSVRILVVDDDRDVREMLREALSDASYRVDCARDAEEALELIRANIYAAAILDFDLPGMNGVMLHRKIREMDPELARATLFISGMVQDDEHLDYYSRASGGFFSKPFNVIEIATEVRALVRGSG